MNRTVSSDRPLGALSDSISVSNPYLYWSTSIRRTWSTVSCTAGIRPSAHGFKDRGLDLSDMVGVLSLGHPICGRLNGSNRPGIRSVVQPVRLPCLHGP